MRAFSAANLRAGLTGLRRQYNFCKERDTVVEGSILCLAALLCTLDLGIGASLFQDVAVATQS